MERLGERCETGQEWELGTIIIAMRDVREAIRVIRWGLGMLGDLL